MNPRRIWTEGRPMEHGGWLTALPALVRARDGRARQVASWLRSAERRAGRFAGDGLLASWRRGGCGGSGSPRTRRQFPPRADGPSWRRRLQAVGTGGLYSARMTDADRDRRSVQSLDAGRFRNSVEEISAVVRPFLVPPGRIAVVRCGREPAVTVSFIGAANPCRRQFDSGGCPWPQPAAARAG